MLENSEKLNVRMRQESLDTDRKPIGTQHTNVKFVMPAYLVLTVLTRPNEVQKRGESCKAFKVTIFATFVLFLLIG